MTERDPVVRRALEQLDVPEHGPAFWDRLEARLANEPVVPVEVEPGADDEVSLDDVVPLRGRRGPRRGLWLGIAAALVLLVGAVTLLAQQDASEDVPAVTSAPTTTTTGPTPTPVPDLSALQAIDRFLVALADGDTDAAWSMLAPRSRDMWGTKERFARASTELASGMSTWLQADRHQEMTITVAKKANRRVEVVVIEGRRPVEGDIEHGWLAMPAYYDGAEGTYLLDPFGQGTSAPPIEPLEPPASPDRSPTPVRPDTGFAVSVDDPTAPVYLKLDNQPEVVARADRNGVVRWQPGEPLSPGEHLVGVAYLAGDGSAYAWAIAVIVD